MSSSLRLLCSRLNSGLCSPVLLNASKKAGCSLKAAPSHFPQQLKVKLNSSLSSVLSVPEKFRRDMVVPDVISTPPPIAAKVVYPGENLDCGTVLTPTQVQDPPTVTWPTKQGEFYTLLMTDPDAPSRAEPKFREWRHWLVVNIPECEVGKGEEVEVYIGSGPPKGTGLHRFVFLVYKQPGRIKYTDPRLGFKTANRGNTKVSNLATKYGLGDPIAGNYYQAMWDEFVPILYQKLGGSLF